MCGSACGRTRALAVAALTCPLTVSVLFKPTRAGRWHSTIPPSRPNRSPGFGQLFRSPGPRATENSCISGGRSDLSSRLYPSCSSLRVPGDGVQRSPLPSRTDLLASGNFLGAPGQGPHQQQPGPLPTHGRRGRRRGHPFPTGL